jgi:hypothetical protein
MSKKVSDIELVITRSDVLNSYHFFPLSTLFFPLSAFSLHPLPYPKRVRNTALILPP